MPVTSALQTKILARGSYFAPLNKALLRAVDTGQDRYMQLNEWQAPKHLLERPLLPVVILENLSTQLMKATAGKLLSSKQVSCLLTLSILRCLFLSWSAIVSSFSQE